MFDPGVVAGIAVDAALMIKRVERQHRRLDIIQRGAVFRQVTLRCRTGSIVIAGMPGLVGIPNINDPKMIVCRSCTITIAIRPLLG